MTSFHEGRMYHVQDGFMNILSFFLPSSSLFSFMYYIGCYVHHFNHSLLELEFLPSLPLSVCFSTGDKVSS